MWAYIGLACSPNESETIIILHPLEVQTETDVTPLFVDVKIPCSKSDCYWHRWMTSTFHSPSCFELLESLRWIISPVLWLRTYSMRLHHALLCFLPWTCWCFLGLCLRHRKPAEQWRSRAGKVGEQQVNALLCDGVRIITAGLEPPLLLLLCCSEETTLRYRIALEFVLYVSYNGAFIHLVE